MDPKLRHGEFDSAAFIWSSINNFQSNFQCHFGHYGRKDFQGTKWNQGYDCGQIESTHYNHVRPRCRYVSKVKRRLLYRGSLLNISKLIWNNVCNTKKNVIFLALPFTHWDENNTTTTLFVTSFCRVHQKTPNLKAETKN